MFSTDASDMLVSISPAADALACAVGGSVSIVPSCVNGVSSHDVTTVPYHSVSVTSTSTSI
jgi:hypothetical protein